MSRVGVVVFAADTIVTAAAQTTQGGVLIKILAVEVQCRYQAWIAVLLMYDSATTTAKDTIGQTTG